MLPQIKFTRIMKVKKVLKKMQRFVELSNKFSKSESEVFPKDESRNTLVSNTFTGALVIGNTGNSACELTLNTALIAGIFYKLAGAQRLLFIHQFEALGRVGWQTKFSEF